MLLRHAIQRSRRHSVLALVSPTFIRTAPNFVHWIEKRQGNNQELIRLSNRLYVDSTVISDVANDGEAHDISPTLKDLNPNQVEAVTQPLCSITRVVAGPGSGKTRVLTSRIAWILQQQEYARVLAVTFTRKASGEMQNRVQTLLTESDCGDQLDRVTLGTFHSICAKILRWNGLALGTLPSIMDDLSKTQRPIVLDGAFNIVDQAEQLRFLKESLADYEIDLKEYDLKPTQLLNAIGKVKEMLVAGENPFPKNYRERQSPARRVACKIYYNYREKMLSTNCLDFNDLIYLSRELLLIDEEVRERLQRRWSHVLVDEFQDTSQTQMDLVKLLTSSSLFVVGDADQSIYSWRGAKPESLSDFDKDFKGFHEDGVSTVYLMENYRSTASIVKAAQRVISSSDSKKSSGADELRQAMIPKRSAGLAPRIVACEDGKAEAQFIVNRIKELVESGEYTADRSIALIYRTNAQSRQLEEACVLQNLPYVIFGSATSFYKRQEIKDCLCFVRWLYNGRDYQSMIRAMTTPKRGIGDRALRDFEEYCALLDQHFAENHPEVPRPTPLEALYLLSGDKSWCLQNSEYLPHPSLSLSNRPLKLLESFSKQMVALRNSAKTKTVDELLQDVISVLELMPHFDKISKTQAEFDERKENVEELQEASRRYSHDGACLPDRTKLGTNDDELFQSPLGNFLDDVALVTEMADQTERSTEKRLVVNLMTVHASKGMEFDTVFFVGIEDGTVPTQQAINEGEGSVVLEEEKRLCYVAMTRAKSELVMSWRREVPIFTPKGMRYVTKRRSRFLDALISKKGTSRSFSASASNQSRKSPPLGKTGSPLTKRPTARPLSTPASRRSVPTIGTQPRPIKTAHPPQAVFPRRIKANPIQDRTRPAERNSSMTKPGSRPRIHQAKRKTSTPLPTKNQMDSTWFFPIGSRVLHKQLGEGIVVPPSKTSADDMRVLVKFPSGETREFSALGTEISPIVA